MSEIQDVCAALEAIDGDILRMARELHGKAQSYNQAAQRAAATAHGADGEGTAALTRTAAALAAAARHCAQAATALMAASQEGKAYVKRTVSASSNPGYMQTGHVQAEAQGRCDELDDADRTAILNYTRPEYYGLDSYFSLNETIKVGNLDQVRTIAAYSNALSNALRKLTFHEGTVFRGASKPLTPEELARYEPGEIVTEPQYTSSTIDPDKEFSQFGGNAIWVIDSKQGHYIGNLAHPEVRHEREVLFDRFARFEVLAKEYNEELHVWVIYMEEIS